MLKVLIGIPTYKGSHRLDWLLYSIYLRTDNKIDYAIVVCDDSGQKEYQEQTISVVNKYKKHLPIELLINDRNLGISKSWNRLSTFYDSQHIILINDDIIVDNNWLKNMIFFLDNNHDIGAAFYDFIKIEENEIPKLFSHLNSHSQNDSRNKYPIRCMTAVGCFFGFSREKYNIVGGFDENYLSFFEESDFCTVLSYYGYPNYKISCPRCWHMYSASFKSSPELNYSKTMAKSKQYYYTKWGKDAERIYMSNIPFQPIKWICRDIIYEDIITDKYGYYAI